MKSIQTEETANQIEPSSKRSNLNLVERGEVGGGYVLNLVNVWLKLY